MVFRLCFLSATLGQRFIYAQALPVALTMCCTGHIETSSCMDAGKQFIQLVQVLHIKPREQLSYFKLWQGAEFMTLRGGNLVSY